jgi:hypothetical protein
MGGEGGIWTYDTKTLEKENQVVIKCIQVLDMVVCCFSPSVLPLIARISKVVSALVTVSTVVIKLHFVWLLYQRYILLKPFTKMSSSWKN